MNKFGLVIAIGKETEGVLKAFGKAEKITDNVFPVYLINTDNAQLYIVSSGIGQIAAAAATQYLICNYGVSIILNFGFVGTLNRNLCCQDVVIVRDVVHYEIDTSLIDNINVGRYLDYPDEFIPLDKNLIEKTIEIFPELKITRLASGDKFIASAEKKEWLINNFKADICDMECAAITLVANRNNIPVLSIKVISDNADENSPITFSKIAEQGTEDCAKILVNVIKNII